MEQLRHKYLQDPLQHALNLKAAEDDFSITGDDLAATLTVLRQMDEELAFKTRELDNIVAEHEDVLAVVEQEWRDEVEEARAEAKELRDVRLRLSQLLLLRTIFRSWQGASPSAKISASPSPTTAATMRSGLSKAAP